MAINIKTVENAYNAIRTYLFEESERKDTFRVLAEKEKVTSLKRTPWVIPAAEERMYDSMMEMKEVIAQHYAKQNGSGDLRKAMRGIIKNVNPEARIGMAGLVKIGDYSYACDGYSMIRTTQNDLGIEPPKESNGTPPHLDNIFDTTKANEYFPVELPTIGELKTYIAEHKTDRLYTKTGNGVTYFIENEDGKFISAYNSKYLLNILKGFGDGNYKAYIRKDPHRARIAPIYIANEDKSIEAILVPIRFWDDAEFKDKVVA